MLTQAIENLLNRNLPRSPRARELCGERAVAVDGSLRLPCVRLSDLAAIARVSEGRLPEIAEARRKYAPQRRRR